MAYDKNERNDSRRIDPNSAGEQTESQQSQDYQQQSYQQQSQGYQNNQQQGQGYRNYQQQNYQNQGFQQQTYQNNPSNEGFSVPPSSNMIWAILATIFCCLPFGIVSIVYAAKVDSFWAAGQYAAAYDAASKSKKWTMWSVIISAIGWVLYIGLFIIIGLGASYSNSY